MALLLTNSLLPSATGGPTSSNSIPVSLVYSGTNVAVNAAAGTHFRLLATNNFLLQNPTGASDSQRMTFEIIQDAAGVVIRMALLKRFQNRNRSFPLSTCIHERQSAGFYDLCLFRH